MVIKILDSIKNPLGIEISNVGFDEELLQHINAIAVNLVHMGVDELDILIDVDTEWPAFANQGLLSLVITYSALKVRSVFDPSASDSISRSFNKRLEELEGLICFQVEEIANGV
jgi:hypothetical protein